MINRDEQLEKFEEMLEGQQYTDEMVRVTMNGETCEGEIEFSEEGKPCFYLADLTRIEFDNLCDWMGDICVSERRVGRDCVVFEFDRDRVPAYQGYWA